MNPTVLLTVLHEGYVSQQARVHALATQISGTSMSEASAATLLLNNDGIPTRLVRWKEASPEAKAYFDSIEEQLIRKRD